MNHAKKPSRWYHSISPRKRLGVRLLIWFFVVSIVPLALIGIVGSALSTKTGNSAALRTVTYSFNQELKMVNNYFRRVKQFALLQSGESEVISFMQTLNTVFAASDPAVFVKSAEWKSLASMQDPYFQRVREIAGFQDVLLTDLSGNVLYSTLVRSDLGTNLISGKFANSQLGKTFKRVNEVKKLIITEFNGYEPAGNQQLFYIMVPIIPQSDSLIGYIGIQYSSESLEQILQAGNDLGSSARAFFINAAGKTRLSSDLYNKQVSESENRPDAKITSWIDYVKSRQFSQPFTDEITLIKNDDGKESLKYISAVEELNNTGVPYALVQEIGPEDAFGYSTLINYIMIGMLIIITILVFITALVVTRRILIPINQLSEWANRVVLGDLSGAEIEERQDEIGMMTDSFTKVVASFHEVAEVNEAMSLGDFSKSVRIRSDQDRMGISANAMLESINSVIAQTERISKGDYSSDILPRSEKDTLGKALFKMTRTLRETSREISDQDWLKSGMAEISILMSGEKSMADLTREITRFMVRYLDGQIGLCYLHEENTLKLVATYAFSDRKGNFSQLEIGEGLVGQAALEKEIILFNDVHENAPALNFSIDEKIPAHYIVAPIIFDKELIGVIQIGSVNPFTPLQRKYIEQVREPIAIGMNTAQSRNQVRILLAQTQQQAEKLQVQQEELRQTNEELEEQTRALKSSEESLQSQQEELRVINEELEERTKALEEQRDDIRRNNVELEMARQEIEDKAEDLEKASKYKSEFLANMSHELRTPLNSIIVLSQLLSENKRANLTDKQIEFAKTINSSGADLLELINEILDLSKIESGKIELHPEHLSLREFATQLEQLFRPLAEKKHLELKTEFGEGIPDTIYVDSQRLQQILRNLLSNAIKFTEKGSVKIRIGRPETHVNLTKPGLNPNRTITFSIIDTGIGIPKEKLGVIFEAFQQADGTTSRKFGGTGLGLTISRSFASLLEGEIFLTSVMGKGSTFTLALPEKHSFRHETPEKENTLSIPPVRSTADEPVFKPGKPQLEKICQSNDDRDIIHKGDKTLLIIEDDLKFADVLYELAHEKGFKCLISPNGECGLHFADFYSPSAIILDIGLPGIDGWEVMDRLKENPKTRHIPVHFISATEKTTDALKLGAIGFLTKPVNIERLNEAFGRIEEVISKKVKKLLVVEDDRIIQKSIVGLIGNGDVKTTVVSKGAEAYQWLENETFDCMILDLGLEDMTGFELIEKIKANKKIAYTPIIIYTGRDLSKTEEEQLKSFADSIIIKGIRSPERLLAETTLFLHRVEANLPKEKQEILKMMYGKEDSFNGRTILLVDDDSRNVFALASVLEEKGLKVHTAFNGRDSIEQLKNHPEIDLVLMDVMMPEMDGFEATGIIRAMPEYTKLPIIALTAKAMKEDREKCLEAGANDYLSKPVDSQKLLSLLRVWLYK